MFWADPSGANAVYNWDTGRYEDENGNKVTFEDALMSYGIGSNENEVSPPTKFITESGEVIAETDDGSDDIYVVENDKLGSVNTKFRIFNVWN